MTKLQQHYYNFQLELTIPNKILYLKKHSKDLSRYNININNLIKAWETNNWPWNNKQKEDPDRIGF